MTIDCAFYAFLSADAEPRVSGAGKNWVRLRAGVGRDDVQWVQIAVFGSAAENAATLKKSDRIYVEGTIAVREWRDSAGADRHGLSVAAYKVEKTHNIGRNKKQKPKGKDTATRRTPAEQGAPLDDPIPF